MRLFLALLFCSTSHAATLYRVACGGPGGADAAGQVWASDAPFVTGGAPYTSAALALLPVPYRSLRSSVGVTPFSYAFPVAAGGNYTVTLLFREPRDTQSIGMRIFSVSINGAVVMANLDLFAAHGLAPQSYSFPVSNPTGPLTIALLSSVGNAVVSGILIDGDAPPAPMLGRKGLLSARPGWPASACDGNVDFYSATDTKEFWACLTGTWNLVLSTNNIGTFVAVGATGKPPPNPPPGNLACWFDGTENTLLCKDSAGTVWGLVKRGVPLAQVDQCSGSGSTFNCAGLYRVAFPLADASILRLIGVPDTTASTAGVTWTPVN